MKTNLLNKLYRKVNLDKEMGQEWPATRGIFDWVRLIRRIDDTILQKLCGTDIALYIVFLRYSSHFFLLISLINMVSIILFYTGDPKPELDISSSFNLKHLTIENSSNSAWKVWIVFHFSMVGVACLFLRMTFNYVKKYRIAEKSKKATEKKSMESTKKQTANE